MNGIFISNLPTNITAEELNNILKKALPEGDRNFGLRLFDTPDGKRKRATVRGFHSTLKDVIQKLETIRIKNAQGFNQNIQVKSDRGDERDRFGYFLKPFSGPEKRAMYQLTGQSSRKVITILNPEFSQLLRPVTNLSTPMVHAYLNGIDREEFGENTAEIVSIFMVTRKEKIHGNEFCRITYRSICDMLQGLSVFNQKKLENGLLVFTDEHGRKTLSLNRQCGIGRGNTQINVQGLQLENGYLPFDTLDETLLNHQFLKNAQNKCWKCHSGARESSYQMLGVSADLTYLAGICNCNYEMDLPVLHIDRPFKFQHEKFTRLVQGRHLDNSSSVVPTLILQHEPMKENYESPMEYRDLVAPILFDDWKTFSTMFKELYKSDAASIVSFSKIETLVTETGQKTDLFFMEISIPYSKVWKEDKLTAIKHLTVTLNVSTDQGQTLRREIRKAKLVHVNSIADGLVHLYTRVILPHRWKPFVQETVTVIPKPVKLEYQNTVRTLNKWAKEEIHGTGLDIILHTGTTSLLAITGISERNHWGPLRKRITDNCRKLQSSLNVEQVAAFNLAKCSSISVVQGPPGTGKTYWTAAAATLLKLKEKGVILACASSNEAANAIAVSLIKVSRSFSIPLRVCRVFSKSNEKYFLRKNQIPFENCGVYCLHLIIRKDPAWLLGEQFQDIKKLLDQNLFHLLTEEQTLQLEKHVSLLEQKALGLFDVIVATIGTLSDQRIYSWNQGSKITTLFLDEVGQTKQTEMPFLFTFGQKRTCLIGDHLQLKPLVHSLAASHAGLEKSIMEWLDLGGKKVPWTLLKEQHRMTPTIRDFTSYLTYNDELRDAESVLTRLNEIPLSVYPGNAYLEKNDIIVFNHNGVEQKHSSSYFNEKEAEIVTMVAQNLLKGGLQPNNLTILTFYEAQKSLIKSKLQSYSEAVNVMNVDSFQGKENHVIILSLSRSNTRNDLGFSKMPNRLNVAVSRAMFKLIITCNLDFFGKSNVGVVKKFVEKLSESAVVINGNDFLSHEFIQSL